MIKKICSFQKKIFSNLTCVLIYSLILKTTVCSEKFVKLAETYPWRSLLLRKLQYLELPFF